MSEQMEKLVEEIRDELSCISWGFHRKHAEELIARIGKAYADGLPLPGEVGRGKGYADTKGYDSGFAGQADVELEIDEHTVRRSQVYDGDRLEFIALREEVDPVELLTTLLPLSEEEARWLEENK